MTIKNIKIQNWRNQNKENFDFSDITVFIGENAVGKTNILESIYFLACGKSFRTKDEFLIQWKKDFARLEGEIEKEGDKEKIVTVLEKRNRIIKTVMIKGQKKPSSHLLGHLYAVLFTPEEIDLISTLPEARRRYLNLTISQSDNSYAFSLRNYKKTLEHRNALLKRIFEGGARKEELEVWDGKLAEYGAEIIKKRDEFIEKINKTISENYYRLSGRKQDLQIFYKPSVRGEWAGLVLKLAENRERDVLSRVTNIGPHRDDFEFQIDYQDVNNFASRGEFRSIVLALKLSEVEYFTQVTGEKPVLLLDDVFSELDLNRRDYLSQIFKEQQTVVTTTDLDHISENIIKEAKVINL